MIRSATRLLLHLLSIALLTGFFVPAVRADGPKLTAKFGIAGRYRPGGWCLVTVGVTNPGPDTLSGQIQVVAANADNGSSPFGRRGGHPNTPAAVFALPVSVPGGSTTPHNYSLYTRGIDPGQADLTVQLVEGRERGDGHILAQINNQNPNTASAFTNGPVTPGDSLFVGFGGDPGAFLFLNGRHLNGMTVQVAEAAGAADLPGNAAGYDGVDAFLLRSDAPLDALTEAQTSALKGWVATGGHLVVCGGSDPARFGAAFFEGLLPATVSEAGASGLLTLTPKPLPGVQVLSTSPSLGPSLVTGPYGAGSVALAAYDPTAAAFQAANSSAMPSIWHSLLSSPRDRSASVIGMTAAREENFNAYYFGSSPPQLSEAVMRGPSLDAPSTSVIATFLLIYLVILVPVNYLVLKRMDRKEWAWATIPALVLLFAAGTFGVGYAAKGGTVFINRAAIIETTAGRQEAGVYSEVGLFSPHRSSYDIDLGGSNLVVAVPNPAVNYSGRGGDTQDAGSAQFVETPAGVSLLNTPVNMWAMRAFDGQSTVNLGGAIDAKLTDESGTATGTITNHTSYTLTDCAVYYGGSWWTLGTLAPGATGQIPEAGPNVGLQSSLSVPVPKSGSSSIQERMHVALGNYYRSLWHSGANYSNGTQPPSYAPSPREALLAGWSSDPKLAGPTPKVDGHSVTENDESLILVHLPVGN